MLGKEHSDTLTSMINLARVLSSQGKYDEAEEIHRQVLALRERVLGKDHPDTLTSMNNLAGIEQPRQIQRGRRDSWTSPGIGGKDARHQDQKNSG